MESLQIQHLVQIQFFLSVEVILFIRFLNLVSVRFRGPRVTSKQNHYGFTLLIDSLIPLIHSFNKY